MMTLDGSGWGIGVQLGMHLRLNDKLSLGLTYKSGVSLDVYGSAGFSRVEDNLFAKEGQLPRTEPTGVHGKIRLPDSLALGLAFYPTNNLSFVLGTVFTRWSTYKSLNVSFDSGYNLNEAKNWRDGWTFNASVEYELVNRLALRAGVWHETPVTDEAHADFMAPSHGRTGVSLGTGISWQSWKLDVGYAHIW